MSERDLANLTIRNSAVKDFEKQVATYAGTRHAVLCSSGRTAIFFSLLALGIKPRDEIIIPDYSCQILPIVVFCAGGIPKFCDLNKRTLGLSNSHLKKIIKPNTKVVIIVHPYGIPVDPSSMLELAQKNGIFLISDAAQALTANIYGRNVSSFGDVGIFSFNKFLNVNLGAAVVTDRPEIAEKIEFFRNKFEFKSYFASIGYSILKYSDFELQKIIKKFFFGTNYLHKFLFALSEKKHFQVVDGWVRADQYLLEKYQNRALNRPLISHLMAYNSLDKYYVLRKMEEPEILDLAFKFTSLQKIHEKRTILGKRYEHNLKEGEFEKFFIPNNFTGSYFRYPILFSDEHKRTICLDNLTKAGFQVNYKYKPLHMSPLFKFENSETNFSNSVYLSKRLLPLPLNSNLRIKDIDRIIQIVNSST